MYEEKHNHTQTKTVKRKTKDEQKIEQNSQHS